MSQSNLPQSNRWKEITGIWKEYSGLYAFTGFLLGFVTYPALQTIGFRVDQFLVGLAPEFLGIFVTVVIVDTFYRHREEERLKHDLIREMGSFANPVAIRAVEALRDQGWLNDGTLTHKRFDNAQLQNVIFDNTTFHQCTFYRSNCNGVVAYQLHATSCQFGSTIFKNAGFKSSNFENSQLNCIDGQGARFSECNLEDVTFVEANLQHCAFTGSNLRGVDFDRANLQDVDFDKVVFDENTILPDGKLWSPDIDLAQYTDSKHPNFWRPTDNHWMMEETSCHEPWWAKTQL